MSSGTNPLPTTDETTPPPPARGLRGTRVAAAVVIGLIAAAVGLAGAVTRWFRPAPSIESVPGLIAGGRYVVAEGRLKPYLATFPRDPRANLYMAEVLIERRNPDPKQALVHLDAARAVPESMQADVLVVRGKADYQLHRLAAAEAAWLAAMKRNPAVAEAGWLLIELYYLEGRRADARRVALGQARVEPDPRDRVRYLLELTREEVQPLAASERISSLELPYHLDPDATQVALAYGRALAREGKADEAIEVLEKLVAKSPDNPDAWEALLGGLEEVGERGELAAQFERVPARLKDDPRLATARGILALERRDFPAAVEAYRRALAVDPSDPKRNYRLAQALKLAGRADEAAPYEAAEARDDALRAELKELYDSVAGRTDLRPGSDPALFERFAALREQMGHPDEARAWRVLARP